MQFEKKIYALEAKRKAADKRKKKKGEKLLSPEAVKERYRVKKKEYKKKVKEAKSVQSRNKKLKKMHKARLEKCQFFKSFVEISTTNFFSEYLSTMDYDGVPKFDHERKELGFNVNMHMEMGESSQVRREERVVSMQAPVITRSSFALNFGPLLPLILFLFCLRPSSPLVRRWLTEGLYQVASAPLRRFPCSLLLGDRPMLLSALWMSMMYSWTKSTGWCQPL